MRLFCMVIPGQYLAWTVKRVGGYYLTKDLDDACCYSSVFQLNEDYREAREWIHLPDRFVPVYVENGITYKVVPIKSK